MDEGILAIEPKVQTKEEFWQNKIDKWKISGLKQGSFCSENDLSYSTFVHWRSKLLKRSNSKNGSKFTTIQVAACTSIQSSQDIKIKTPSGLLIALPLANFEQSLKILLKTMGLL